MTRMQRTFTNKISENPSNLRYQCAIKMRW